MITFYNHGQMYKVYRKMIFLVFLPNKNSGHYEYATVATDIIMLAILLMIDRFVLTKNIIHSNSCHYTVTYVPEKIILLKVKYCCIFR